MFAYFYFCLADNPKVLIDNHAVTAEEAAGFMFLATNQTTTTATTTTTTATPTITTTTDPYICENPPEGKFNAGNGYAGCNAAANKESFTGGSSKRMCSGNPVTNSERPSDWPYTFFRSCCKWESSIQRCVDKTYTTTTTTKTKTTTTTTTATTTTTTTATTTTHHEHATLMLASNMSDLRNGSDWRTSGSSDPTASTTNVDSKAISSQPESATNRGREESSTVDDDGSSNRSSVAGAVGGSLVAICVLAAVGFFAVKKKNSTPQATQATQARAGSAAVQPGAASATLAHNPVYSPPAAAVAAASGGLYETIDDDSVAWSMAPAGQAEGYELQAVPGTASAQRSNPATMPSHEHYSGYTVAAPKTPIVYAVPVGDDGVAGASKSLPSHDNYSGYTVAAQKPPIVYAGPVADEVRTTAQSVYEVAELVPAEHYVYAETAVAEYAVIPAVPDDPDLSGYC